MYKKPLQKIIRLGCLFIGVISLAMLALNFWSEQTGSSGQTGSQVGNGQSGAGQKVPKCFVVYAKRDVPAGRTVTKNDIEARLLDEDRIPEDAVTKADDAVGK
jgi:Flp pilus assembly protein CpaB